MIEVPGTWADVTAGTTLLSPTGNPLLIIRTEVDAKGRTWYQSHDHTKHKATIRPKPSDAPVTLLECTPEEAELAAIHGLGAERIIDFERDARIEQRSRQWVVPPLATTGRTALDKARDHVGWYHGTYSGSAENGGFKTLKQILAAHAEMHEQQFTDKPHTHKEA